MQGIIQKPMLGELPDWTRFPAPVGLWLFNEGAGSLVNDLSGNKKTGTLVADTHWVGRTLAFDGTGDEVVISLPPGLAVTSPITVIIKAKSAVGAWEYLFSVQEAGGAWDGQIMTCLLGYDGSNTVRISHQQAIGHSQVSNDNIILTDWHQYAFTHSGAAERANIYVDGVLNNSGSGTAVTTVGDNQITIGRGITVTYDFTGQVEYMIVFDRVLSAQQIIYYSHKSSPPWFVEDDISGLYAPGAPPEMSIPLLMQQMNQFNGGMAA